MHPQLFNQSFKFKITPLLIYGLEGVHTQRTQTYQQPHKSDFKKPSAPGLIIICIKSCELCMHWLIMYQLKIGLVSIRKLWPYQCHKYMIDYHKPSHAYQLHYVKQLTLSLVLALRDFWSSLSSNACRISMTPVALIKSGSLKGGFSIPLFPCKYFRLKHQ